MKPRSPSILKRSACCAARCESTAFLFEAALNDAIRRGLSESAADAEPRFTVTARPMRLRSEADPVRLQDLDAALEVRRFQALDARLRPELESR